MYLLKVWQSFPFTFSLTKRPIFPPEIGVLVYDKQAIQAVHVKDTGFTCFAIYLLESRHIEAHQNLCPSRFYLQFHSLKILLSSQSIICKIISFVSFIAKSCKLQLNFTEMQSNIKYSQGYLKSFRLNNLFLSEYLKNFRNLFQFHLFYYLYISTESTYISLRSINPICFNISCRSSRRTHFTTNIHFHYLFLQLFFDLVPDNFFK